MNNALLKMVIILGIFTILSLMHPVYATDWIVCETAGGSCSHTGPAGIQQAIDEAKNGDTILIKAGTYKSGTQLNPFQGPGVKTCFIDLKGKDLIIKGEGSLNAEYSGTVLYGEGHDITRSTNKPGDASSTYYSRGGICSNGGKITIDNIHVKEFEGGGMSFVDAQVTLKNSLVDGNDHGGIFIAGSSSLFAINNNFVVTNVAIMPSGGASVKAINNIFWGKALEIACNDTIPPLDFINNVVFDIETTIGVGGLTSTCPEQSSGFKSQNIKYNVFWKNETNDDGTVKTPHECYGREYCEWTKPNNPEKNFNAYPNLDAPVTDQGGWKYGGNFSPRAGSPVVGAGDPAIPGTKNIGSAGGPCANGTSTECMNFIKNNPPKDPVTPPDINDPDPNPNPNPNPNDNNNQLQNPFGIPLPLSRLIDLPENVAFSNPLSKATKTTNTDQDDVFGLFTYVVLSIVYMMVMNFALNMGSEFSIWFMGSFFILGGVIGGWFHNYEFGFVVGVVLSLLFIGGPKKEM